MLRQHIARFVSLSLVICGRFYNNEIYMAYWLIVECNQISMLRATYCCAHNCCFRLTTTLCGWQKRCLIMPQPEQTLQYFLYCLPNTAIFYLNYQPLQHVATLIYIASCDLNVIHRMLCHRLPSPQFTLQFQLRS